MKIHLHSDWPPTASSTTDRQGGRSARERPGQEDEGGSHPTRTQMQLHFWGPAFLRALIVLHGGTRERVRSSDERVNAYTN